MYLDYKAEQELIEAFESLTYDDVSFEEKAERINNYIFDYGEKIVDIQEISLHISNIVLDFMEKFNIDEKYYEQVYDAFCKNSLYESYCYQDTKVERFSEEDIVLKEEDVMLAQECIKNGIEYCAYYIAERMVDREFVKGPMSPSMIENMLNRYNNKYEGNGDIIEPEKISIFIKSLINILNQKYHSHVLNNEKDNKTYIGVLGFEHFDITANKKFKAKQSENASLVENGYYLDYIDNDYSETIKEALQAAGLEGMFTKSANKRVFKVKKKYFGYSSMNSGHWIPKFDVTSKEKLEEYKLGVIAKMTKDLPSESKSKIITYLLNNNDQEVLEQQTTHIR